MPTYTATLTVNTDTYISLADAEIYLAKTRISTDTALVAWNALTSADKEILLRNAATLIDAQPLQGEKVLTTQVMEFPRILPTELHGRYSLQPLLLDQDGWYIQPSVPDAVKYAQCEIAITMGKGESTRNELQRQGVKSFSLGKLSETYTGAGNQLLSTEAKRLLKPFTDGGFAIC